MEKSEEFKWKSQKFTGNLWKERNSKEKFKEFMEKSEEFS